MNDSLSIVLFSGTADKLHAAGTIASRARSTIPIHARGNFPASSAILPAPAKRSCPGSRVSPRPGSRRCSLL